VKSFDDGFENRKSEVELSSDSSQKVKSLDIMSDDGKFSMKGRSCSKCAICGLVTMFVVNLAIAIVYFVWIASIEHQIYEASRTCSSGTTKADNFADPPNQDIEVYMYNVSNPYEYIAGADAKILETGAYIYGLQLTRGDVQYNGQDDTVSFNLYSNLDYKSGGSCENCDNNKELITFNTPYNFLVGVTQNEAALLLTMTCSSAQIALIPETNASAYPILHHCSNEDYYYM